MDKGKSNQEIKINKDGNVSKTIDATISVVNTVMDKYWPVPTLRKFRENYFIKRLGGFTREQHETIKQRIIDLAPEIEKINSFTISDYLDLENFFIEKTLDLQFSIGEIKSIIERLSLGSNINNGIIKSLTLLTKKEYRELVNFSKYIDLLFVLIKEKILEMNKKFSKYINGFSFLVFISKTLDEIDIRYSKQDEKINNEKLDEAHDELKKYIKKIFISFGEIDNISLLLLNGYITFNNDNFIEPNVISNQKFTTLKLNDTSWKILGLTTGKWDTINRHIEIKSNDIEYNFSMAPIRKSDLLRKSYPITYLNKFNNKELIKDSFLEKNLEKIKENIYTEISFSFHKYELNYEINDILKIKEKILDISIKDIKYQYDFVKKVTDILNLLTLPKAINELKKQNINKSKNYKEKNKIWN